MSLTPSLAHSLTHTHTCTRFLRKQPLETRHTPAKRQHMQSKAKRKKQAEEENEDQYLSLSIVKLLMKKWIALLARHLSTLVRWPSTEKVRTMLITFQKFFSKCVCIAVCTEIFIDRPSDFKI